LNGIQEVPVGAFLSASGAAAMGAVLGAVTAGKIRRALACGGLERGAWALGWAALLCSSGGLLAAYYSNLSTLIFLAGGVAAGGTWQAAVEARGRTAAAGSGGRMA
jgi:hypothetical protein